MNIDDIAITMQHGLGAKGIAHLMSTIGSASRIYGSTEDELVETGELRRELARDILRKSYHREAEKEMRFLGKHGLSAVSSTDESYPSLLRECADYPHVLYVMGNPDVLTGRSLSMVGTRTITPYGQRMCDAIIGRMAELTPGTTIVSGLAFGVDANCHRAALRYGLPTLAVVANAFPGVTPAQNGRLAEEIVAAGGAVITELHSQTKQNGAFYIPRNRIIAGMSEGTVVIESAVNGGSLSTAGFADGYDRIVMAVPGRAGDRCSEGTNLMIKRRKASMVCSGDDIIHELGWDISVPGEVPGYAPNRPVLSIDEQALLKCFGEGETVDMDTLSSRSGMAIGLVAALLLNLEIGGIVRSLPGKMYEIV